MRIRYKYTAIFFLSVVTLCLAVLPARLSYASDADKNTARDIPYLQKIGRGLNSEKETTLADKAKRFEEIIRKRHVWRGFIRELTLEVSGYPTRGGVLHHNDNDGLWTSLYVAAMSFKYAATQDKRTLQWAKESFHALEWLESVTGISGFPARSIVSAGDPKKFKYDGEWHTDSSRKWEWKGNTSSDEIAGHFFAYSVYYDLAADEKEKKRVRQVVARIMDHIIDHNWYLTDTDGRPTRWGVWNPEQLNSNLPMNGEEDIDWHEERGLNSLLILSHLKTAYHITGQEKYQQKYLELIEKHGYAENTVRLKITAPPEVVNHSDDELAFCAYYPLLKYETDPKLRAIYHKSLDATWRIERPERNPWWNFTFCAFIGEDCAIDDSIRTLRELSWEQINWRRENILRKDVRFDPNSPAGHPQSLEVLPYNEITILRWNGNPYQLDSGGNGEIEGDGVIFLLPYWIGRYYKFILHNDAQ